MDSLLKKHNIYKSKTLKLLLVCIIFLLSLNTKSFSEEVLSKGEAIALISAADFVKRKIGDLLSWTVGYDISRVNRVKLVPSIKYIKAVPKKIPPDGRTILEIAASVEDPQGLPNISGVRADLSSIGRLPNMMLVDNGLWGDKVAGDGVYTLQANVAQSVNTGDKEIPVAAANKGGWLTISRTMVVVDNTPTILEAKVYPTETKRNTNIKISAKVEFPNPGDQNNYVYANLKDVGQGEKVVLQYASGTLFSIDTAIPGNIPPGKKRIRVFAANEKGEGNIEEVVLEVLP